MERLLSYDSVQDLKLDIPDGCREQRRGGGRGGGNGPHVRDKKRLLHTLHNVDEEENHRGS